MTHTRNTPASGAVEVDEYPVGSGEELDDRSRRAWSESMSVVALGRGQYTVEVESGNEYLVDVEEGRCSCPDHVIRGVRCKHMRRVAIEITAGRVAPPSFVPSTCASCGGFALVQPGASEPHLCDVHRVSVGDRARDRETGEVVLVVAVSPLRADEVAVPGSETSVAAYETNEAYPDADPVVGAVYPSVRVTASGARPDELRVYSFPVSRLKRVETDR